MYTPLDFWIEYNVWLMLQIYFNGPNAFITANDDLNGILNTVSLNGIKSFNLS
jgi:hypothetical protein